jgi:hypothetical protein
LQALYTTPCFLPPVRLTLTLTPRVLGTYCCVLLLQVLCRMKKLLSGVKRPLSSGPSSRGSGSHSDDNESQDSPWSSSFVPSPHGTTGSSRYLAYDDVPETTDGAASPSTPLRRGRSMSPSTIKSLLILVPMMRTCLIGLVWMKSFSPSSRPSIAESSTMSLI